MCSLLDMRSGWQITASEVCYLSFPLLCSIISAACKVMSCQSSVARRLAAIRRSLDSFMKCSMERLTRIISFYHESGRHWADDVFPHIEGLCRPLHGARSQNGLYTFSPLAKHITTKNKRRLQTDLISINKSVWFFWLSNWDFLPALNMFDYS
jgi:hypothetical protein